MTSTTGQTNSIRRITARALGAVTALTLLVGMAQGVQAGERNDLRPAVSSSRQATTSHRLNRDDRRVIRVDHRRRDFRRDRRHDRRGYHNMNRRDVVRSLRARGFHRIHNVRRFGPVFRAGAVGRRGHPVRVVVSARNGRILDVHRIGWPRPHHRW